MFVFYILVVGLKNVSRAVACFEHFVVYADITALRIFIVKDTYVSAPFSIYAGYFQIDILV